MNITKTFNYCNYRDFCTILPFDCTAEVADLFLMADRNSIWITDWVDSKYFIIFKK